MLYLRRTKSEACLSPPVQIPLAISNDNSAAHEQDVQVLLSRIIHLESELKSALSDPSTKQLASSALSHETPLSPPLPYATASVHAGLAEKLFSLPLMKPILTAAENFTSRDAMDGLDDELFFVLSDAMRDPSSPWSKFMPKPPPISGPRTPGHYLCAINIALAARKETKIEKKIAKFWKQMARRANSPEEDVPPTPSPSQISDTGIAGTLSSSREDRLQELIKKRSTASCDSSGLDARSEDRATYGLHPQLPDGGQTSFPGSDCSDPAFEHYDEPHESSSVLNDDSDRTLVEPPLTHPKTSIPKLMKRDSGAIAPSSFTGNIKSLSLPRKSPKIHILCELEKQTNSQTSPRLSKIASLSVQSKRRLYESLSASPAAPSSIRTGSNDIRSATIPRPILSSGARRNAYQRKLSLETMQCPESLHSSTVKPSAFPNTGRGNASRLKYSSLPQARREISAGAKPASN